MPRIVGGVNMDEDPSPLDNDELSEYDVYGKTPPRTKILRKNRERRQRHSGAEMSSPKVVKGKNPLNRRNTIHTMYDELIAAADNPDLEKGSKKTNKRQLKLLRGSERDLKLDIASAKKAEPYDEIPKTPQPSYQIECAKRFMSLSCRTIQCNKRKSYLEATASVPSSSTNSDEQEIVKNNDECPQSRVEFHNTLSLLIRMGGSKDERNPRRVLSREETMWQNELKDVIWLELQAYHDDRSPTEEDAFLCQARESVGPLLQEIMNYKFQRQAKSTISQNSDSGMEDDCTESCCSVYCVCCLECQNEALREIESLMKRLEDVEGLFPSGKAFAELYPLYNSPEFVGRVKAISVWYNMTKHQRLKLNILGRLLLLLENKQGQWPLLSDDIGSGSSSESNNSTNSSTMENGYLDKGDMYNITPVTMMINKKDENNVSPYRRYIENILKTRALNKSINFLQRLHRFVLRKAQLTLEKPESEDIFTKVNLESDEEELQRYGTWSPESKNLNLPSYRANFLFLATVPLEVLHEYLMMRLDQKPDNPSALSVRQLMRELKEGLRIALLEKERFEKYLESATYGMSPNDTIEMYNEKVGTFEKCIAKVFGDYLDYLQQWVLLHHSSFPKNLLDEEYEFSRGVAERIPDTDEMLGSKYSFIMGSILRRIGERFIKRIDDVLDEMPKETENVKQTLLSVCRELQSLFNEEREMSLKTMTFCKKLMIDKNFIPISDIIRLRDSIIVFKCIIPDAIEKVQALFDHICFTTLEDIDKAALNSRIREILMQVYRFGFEFYREMSDGVPPESRGRLVQSLVHFAYLWMKFVTERCERGRGMRPRWAYQGLEFLLTVCEPSNTRFLSDAEFEDLKKNMDICISHVIGTTASSPDSGFYSPAPRSLHDIRARSRGSSPSPRPTYKSQRSANTPNRKTSTEQCSPGTEFVDAVNFNINSLKKDDKGCGYCVKIKLPPKTHSEHVREAIDALEQELDERLRKQHLIGKVLVSSSEGQGHVRRRNVTFSWQRGIKIGQGRFGKVYTAVNNCTGEMMAVKEIPLQHNDCLTIKRTLEEMKILEGIVHRNLVRYYGVEVHKNEMLIFMEFCAEGTLENLVAATEHGLPELLVRKYAFQLVSGVACLHDHGIVHRDIKTANVFLTDEGNCLKIGDFGCAAKIKANTTMPGELKGFVGTQAYMAPEVFTKNMSEGHGRAADIWSIGCVVIEMASGKRPWAQFDSNYQIMFKVGMGESPDPPEDMIEEGLDFLELCFKFNPKERATAHDLLTHNFVKVGDDLL